MAEPPVWRLLRDTLASYLEGKGTGTIDSLREDVPKGQLSNLDHVLNPGRSGLSYRDVILSQLAYAILSPGLDTTQRPQGARPLGQRLGTFLRSNHITTVADAYQNIGKNMKELARGNFKEFDDFLIWASSATPPELMACFNYGCAVVAATS